MAFSLGWHIVIASFGVAFPAIIYVAHRRGIRGDADGLVLAKRWAKVAGVLFAVGAVSGTILSFEFGLLWPGLMRRFGDVIGLPFALEAIAFFVEAIFLGIYLFGWDRLSPRVHLATLLPMAAAGVWGSFCVVAANAWMNNPSGFRVVNGTVVDVHPLAVLFNNGVWLEWLHMFLAAYMVVGFVIASIYAVALRRGQRDHLHRMGFVIPFAFASLAALVQPMVGHVEGLTLNGAQPSKLAAIELAPHTERRAPLTIGGVLVDGEVRYGIQIPVIGSLIARSSTNAKVVGLADVPEGGELNASFVHLAFQTMVGIAFALLGGVAWFWWKRRRGDPFESRVFLLFAIAAGPLAVIALQAGWTVTEVGRQPWMVYRVLRVDASVTHANWIWFSFTTTLAVYASMTAFVVQILRSMSRRWGAGEADLRAPYGPADDH